MKRFKKKQKTIAELQKIIDKVKEYKLLNSPLSNSVQLETIRQNSANGSVGYKHVHKGTPIKSKDAATYQCRELKLEKYLNSVAPNVSQGVVEEQRQITCFQARLTESRKRSLRAVNS